VKYNYLSYKHRRVGVVSYTVIREIFSVPCVSSVPVVLFRYILPTGYSALFLFGFARLGSPRVSMKITCPSCLVRLSS
jgi:hypothetical protein